MVPGADAMMVVLPTPTGVTVTLAPVELCGMVTLGVTVATLESRLASATTKPPAGAGPPRVTARLPGAWKRSSGFGVSAIVIDCAEIVTVAGALFVNPSFTISCTT